VRLADLTAAYLSYIRALQAVDLDIAGEFLEIAATLILIKSRTLLPRPPLMEEGEEGEDPEEALRRRLMEYQRFKDAAYAIGARDWLGRDVFPRGEGNLEESVEKADEISENQSVSEEVSLIDLLDSFKLVMQRRPKIHQHQIEPERYRIEDRIIDLLNMLQTKASLSYENLYPKSHNRPHLILTFLAVLEMLKHRLIQVVQSEAFGPIHCLPHPDLEKTLPMWRQSESL
ncbi:MAG: segregation/condensation protein A, partial [Proteobacteria bacterium]|nr:segregation/condensation protein A [Pseudomonadota bacterium]